MSTAPPPQWMPDRCTSCFPTIPGKALVLSQTSSVKSPDFSALHSSHWWNTDDNSHPANVPQLWALHKIMCFESNPMQITTKIIVANLLHWVIMCQTPHKVFYHLFHWVIIKCLSECETHFTHKKTEYNLLKIECHLHCRARIWIQFHLQRLGS